MRDTVYEERYSSSTAAARRVNRPSADYVPAAAAGGLTRSGVPRLGAVREVRGAMSRLARPHAHALSDVREPLESPAPTGRGRLHFWPNR